MVIPITFPDSGPSLTERLDKVSRDLDTLRRQRLALELALEETLDRLAAMDTVKQWVQKMERNTV